MPPTGEGDAEVLPPTPIRTYVENGVTVKVYPPLWAEDSTTTHYVRPKVGVEFE